MNNYLTVSSLKAAMLKRVNNLIRQKIVTLTARQRVELVGGPVFGTSKSNGNEGYFFITCENKLRHVTINSDCNDLAAITYAKEQMGLIKAKPTNRQMVETADAPVFGTSRRGSEGYFYINADGYLRHVAIDSDHDNQQCLNLAKERMCTMNIPMPNGLEELVILDDKDQEVRNPFSGETCTLTPQAVAVYDYIKGSEAMGTQDARFSAALSWFAKHYPEEYMILLD